MRILQYTFFSLLFLSISVLVVFAIAQEVLLFWGTASVRSALNLIKEKPSADVCQTYLNDFSETGISVGYQIRFTSDTDFVIEAFCQPFNSNVSMIKEATLPPLVSKIPGSSGIIYEAERSGLGITVFNDVYTFIKERVGIDVSLLQKKTYISIEGKTVIAESTFDSYGQMPLAACEGFGYQCCDSVAQVGTGEQITTNTSCEKSCFSTCLKRPVILSFMSDPFPDLTTRIARVQSNVPVDFQFLSDIKETETATAVIDFGDGETETVTGVSGSTQHSYSCNTGTCQYTASITITDAKGRSSVTTPISILEMIVTR